MTDQNKEEEFMEIDADQLQELMSGSDDSDKLPPIEIPMEFYNTDEFHRGISETSYLAGVITALFNTGVSEGFIADYLLNQETVKHNIRTAEINKDMNIEISRNQKLSAEKNEL